jgi:sodium transport system permease protein
MIPEQVFNTALLGLVLGMLAIRSNSLFPCIVFHFVNNALAVFHGRFGVECYDRLPPSLFFVEEGSLRYRWPTLVVCVAIAAPLLAWLFRPRRAEGQHADANGRSEGQLGGLPLLSLPASGDTLVLPNRK